MLEKDNAEVVFLRYNKFMNKLKTLIKDALSLTLFEVLVLSSPLYLSCLWCWIISLVSPYAFGHILGVYWLSAATVLLPLIFYMKKSDGENFNHNGGGMIACLLLFGFFPFSLLFVGFNLLKEKLSLKANP